MVLALTLRVAAFVSVKPRGGGTPPTSRHSEKTAPAVP
jgi:hypothetical protein